MRCVSRERACECASAVTRSPEHLTPNTEHPPVIVGEVCVETIHIHKVVEKDGEITIAGLPCRKGQHVDAILTIEPSAMSGRPHLTARQLLRSGLIGLWKNRKDIGDSAAYARELRDRSPYLRSRTPNTEHLGVTTDD